MKISKKLEEKIMVMARKKLAKSNCKHDKNKVCDKCFKEAMDGARKQVASLTKHDLIKMVKKSILRR